MRRVRDEDDGRLDEAARAAWLYYVAGNTQDQIAAKLGVSRQTAQRLVSRSVSAGLVNVRIDHPIAACLDLGARLTSRFGLRGVEVVPSDPASTSRTLGVSQACAAWMQKRLSEETPQIIAIGTGRTLKAAVENLPPMECPQHQIVSLTGNIAPDGSASVYNVIFSMADRVQAKHYPMPLPIVVSSAEERRALHSQKVVRSTLDRAGEAATVFVGIGELSEGAPLVTDGFIDPLERQDLIEFGAVAEIVGWVFGKDGRILNCPFNDRVASAPIPPTTSSDVVAVAMGRAKVPGIAAAIRGRLVSSLITDERTATELLDA